MKGVQIFGILFLGGLLLVQRTDASKKLNQLIDVCRKGLNVTEEMASAYRRVEFPDDSTTKCVLRCMALNLGVYDDLSGIHMAATWQMFADGRGPREEKQFAESHFSCIRRNQASVAADDYCGRVWAAYLCYRDEFQALMKKQQKAAVKV
ncbi:general odorant-binding protein 99a-like [Uranotaenia lowii]|uniref:general odorant-binding protein 99a-like n=1 Tax=Uranotaenia lowii TaxID=190385 RepID=UPI0024786A8E|nr:general odorant-binding protein 99a-like [Uranotaenia lowii]